MKNISSLSTRQAILLAIAFSMTPVAVTTLFCSSSSNSALILLATIALALILNWFITGIWIYAPLLELLNTSRRMSDGNFSAKDKQLTPLFSDIRQISSEMESLALRMAEAENLIESLRKSEEKYRIVADNCWDLKYWIGNDGSIIYISPSTLELTGYPREYFLYEPGRLLEIVHKDDQSRFRKLLKTPYLLENPEPFDFRITTIQGEERWFNNKSSVVFDERANPLGRLGCARDITEQRLTELALEKSSEKLRKMSNTLQQRVDEEVGKNREKDRMIMMQARQASMGEMISNIAHHWRQPLNNLGLMIQGIKIDKYYNELTDERLDESVNGCMELIQQMSSTIDTFRNFLKPVTQKCKFSLAATAQQSISFLSASLDENHIETSLEILKDSEIFSYPNEFAQAIINLLSNARNSIKEKAPNSPLIRIIVDAEEQEATVTISDNGSGISDEVMDRLFEPYFTTNRAAQGAGMGLYMAKSIIEKNMGGSIRAIKQESGATFIITLPKD